MALNNTKNKAQPHTITVMIYKILDIDILPFYQSQYFNNAIYNLAMTGKIEIIKQN